MLELELKNGIGPSQHSDPDETREVKKALAEIGYMKNDGAEPNGIPNEELFEGVQKIQRDNGLYQNGAVEPGKATQWMISADLGARRSGRVVPNSLGLKTSFGNTDDDDLDTQNTIAKPLAALGLLTGAETRSNSAVRSGLRRFQMLTELKTDGIAHPGRETEVKLAKAVSGIRGLSSFKEKPATTRLASSSRPSGNWSNPSTWALEEAGRTLYPKDGLGKGQGPMPSNYDQTNRKKEQLQFNENYESGQLGATGNVTRYRVRGPIHIQQSTKTMGLDGVRYHVFWHPLDKDGKPEVLVRPPSNRPIERGGHDLPFVDRPNRLDPPYENEHGWEVRIEVPPQPHYNSNSAWSDINLYLPKGESQIPEPDRR